MLLYITWLEEWLVDSSYLRSDQVISRANDEMSRDSRLQYHGLTLLLVIRLQFNLPHNEGTLGIKFIKDKSFGDHPVWLCSVYDIIRGVGAEIQ